MTKPLYQVAEVMLDETGKYTVQYIGTIAEQGGLAFGYGNYCQLDIKDVLTVIEHELTQNRDQHMDMIKKKGEKNEKPTDG